MRVTKKKENIDLISEKIELKFNLKNITFIESKHKINNKN